MSAPPPTGPERSTGIVLVDAANVIGSRPNGWWRDRAGAARSFVERVRTATVAARLRGAVVVVLEAGARSGADEGEADRVTVVHAPKSGDDLMVALIAMCGEPVTLVTADRELRRRALAAGSAGLETVGPAWLLGRIE